MEIKDRTFMITGASQGIGRSLALALSAAGAKVAVCARNEAALLELAREIESGGGQVFARTCDIGDREGVESFVHEAQKALGSLDGLINNAGDLGPRLDVSEYPAERFEEVLRVNVIGTLNCTQAALAHLLKAEPGLVINISSGLGRFGVAKVSAYCASKFAIEGFSQSLADEHPGTALVVMAVAPGMVATDMLRAFLDTPDVDSYLEPKQVGEGFVKLISGIDSGWTGRSLDIESFLD